MVIKLILTRHGETIANQNNIVAGLYDSPLSKNGLNEAKVLANYLKNYNFDIILSSKLKRVVQTTNEIRRFHANIPYFKCFEIHERSLGIMEGVHNSKFKLIPIPSGYEVNKDLIFRVKMFLENLIKKFDNKIILLVGHNGFNKALIGILLGINEYPKQIIQDNCCINICEIDFEKGHKIKLINSTCFIKNKVK